MSAVPPVIAPPAPPADRRGCGKKALIGCGVAALAAAALCLGFILYVRQKPEVITDFVMRQVESHYAADVTEADKQELRAAYADFRASLKERRDSRDQRLERWRTTVMTSGAKNEFTHEQVQEMIRLFREKQTPSSPAVEITEPPPASPRPTP